MNVWIDYALWIPLLCAGLWWLTSWALGVSARGKKWIWALAVPAMLLWFSISGSIALTATQVFRPAVDEHPRLTNAQATAVLTAAVNSCVAGWTQICTPPLNDGSKLLQHSTTRRQSDTDPNTGSKIFKTSDSIDLVPPAKTRAFVLRGGAGDEISTAATDLNKRTQVGAAGLPGVPIAALSSDIVVSDIVVRLLDVDPSVENVQISKVDPRLAIVSWKAHFEANPALQLAIDDHDSGLLSTANVLGMETRTCSDGCAPSLAGKTTSFTSALYFDDAGGTPQWRYDGGYDAFAYHPHDAKYYFWLAVVILFYALGLIGGAVYLVMRAIKRFIFPNRGGDQPVNVNPPLPNFDGGSRS